MKKLYKFIIIIFIIAIVLGFYGYLVKRNIDTSNVVKNDKIFVTIPIPNSIVTNPIVIKGEARGNWFFEASFPIIIVDWDGLIVGEGIATAESEWMTTDFVPFLAEIQYTLATSSLYSTRGAIILKKDNPSGLPENDEAIEIPILFERKN